MKLVDYFWEHPALSRYIREIGEGNYLFKQKQHGNTMFIILQGLVELIAMRGEHEYVLGIVQSGQFLGEKAIVKESPYRRALSARAKTDVKVLEMDLKAIEAARKVAPEIMNDILKKMFQIAAQRLDRMNYLMAGLRSSNNAERLVHLVLYFSRTNGRSGADGTEFVMKTESVHFYIDMAGNQIIDCLNELIGKGLLRRVNEDCYVLPDELALLKSIPMLRNQLTAGFYDDLEVEPAP